jgi:hypothetical protein
LQGVRDHDTGNLYPITRWCLLVYAFDDSRRV